MASVVDLRPRVRQPQTVVGVDGANPLARDLILSLPLSPGTGYKSLGRDGRTGTPTAVTSTATPQGTAAKFAGAGYINLGATPLMDAATPFTLALYETVDVASGFAGMVGFALSNGKQWLWIRGSDPAYRCAMGPTGGGAPNFASAGPQTAGEKIRWLVTGSLGMGAGTGMRVWANGVEQTFSATNFGAISATSNYIGWDGADDKWQGAIQDVNLWGRVLTDDEIARCFANPYQLFAPEEESTYFPSGGSSAAIAASSSASPQSSSALSTAIALAASSAAKPASTSALSVGVGISASSSASPAATSALSTSIALAASSTARPGSTSTLSTGNGLSASNSASPSSTSALTTSISLAASSAATTWSSAVLTTAIRLAATSSARPSSSSALDVGAVSFVASPLVFTSPARAYAFTSPARAFAFTSPARAYAFTSPARDGS